MPLMQPLKRVTRTTREEGNAVTTAISSECLSSSPSAAAPLPKPDVSTSTTLVKCYSMARPLNAYHWASEPLNGETTYENKDIFVEDSDTSESPLTRAARQRRREEIGRRYLMGHMPFIQAATFRGPFGRRSGWINPWSKREPHTHVGRRYCGIRKPENTSGNGVVRTGESNFRDDFGKQSDRRISGSADVEIQPYDADSEDDNSEHALDDVEDQLLVGCGKRPGEAFAEPAHVVNGDHPEPFNSEDDILQASKGDLEQWIERSSAEIQGSTSQTSHIPQSIGVKRGAEEGWLKGTHFLKRSRHEAELRSSPTPAVGFRRPMGVQRTPSFNLNRSKKVLGLSQSPNASSQSREARMVKGLSLSARERRVSLGADDGSENVQLSHWILDGPKRTSPRTSTQHGVERYRTSITKGSSSRPRPISIEEQLQEHKPDSFRFRRENTRLLEKIVDKCTRKYSPATVTSHRKNPTSLESSLKPLSDKSSRGATPVMNHEKKGNTSSPAQAGSFQYRRNRRKCKTIITTPKSNFHELAITDVAEEVGMTPEVTNQAEYEPVVSTRSISNNNRPLQNESTFKNDVTSLSLVRLLSTGALDRFQSPNPHSDPNWWMVDELSGEVLLGDSNIITDHKNDKHERKSNAHVNSAEAQSTISQVLPNKTALTASHPKGLTGIPIDSWSPLLSHRSSTEKHSSRTPSPTPSFSEVEISVQMETICQIQPCMTLQDKVERDSSLESQEQALLVLLHGDLSSAKVSPKLTETSCSRRLEESTTSTEISEKDNKLLDRKDVGKDGTLEGEAETLRKVENFEDSDTSHRSEVAKDLEGVQQSPWIRSDSVYFQSAGSSPDPISGDHDHPFTRIEKESSSQDLAAEEKNKMKTGLVADTERQSTMDQFFQMFPSTLRLVSAATDNPWTSAMKKSREQRPSKRVSFGDLDLEPEEDIVAHEPFSSRRLESPPPPEGALRLTHLDDHFHYQLKAIQNLDVTEESLTKFMNTPWDDIPAMKARLKPPPSSPSVDAMAEAFIAADKESLRKDSSIDCELVQARPAEETPVRRKSDTEPKQTTKNVLSPLPLDSSMSITQSGNIRAANLGPSYHDAEDNLDAVIEDMGSFLEGWDVDVELKKAKSNRSERSSEWKGLMKRGYLSGLSNL